MFTYGRAWQRKRRPRSEHLCYPVRLALPVGLVACPFYALWPPLGYVVAVVGMVGLFAARWYREHPPE